LRRQRNPAHSRQGDIENDDVRLMLVQRPPQSCAMLERAGDLEFAGQDLMNLTQHGRIVVNEEQTNVFCHGAHFTHRQRESAFGECLSTAFTEHDMAPAIMRLLLKLTG
jgi:hypothetical protein